MSFARYYRYFAFVFISAIFSHPVSANLTDEQFEAFKTVYQKELGTLTSCNVSREGERKVCSPLLKNEGNSPFILQSPESKGIVVLFHGLSDSPFFIRSIAEHLHKNNFTVVVPLTPGHGKFEADLDMQDSILKDRWYQHTLDVMQIFAQTDLPVFIGGFSTGAAFATWYSMQNANNVDGLLSFSGALELSSSAESMSRIWGMKSLAKWLDGEYETVGPNPYKYPKVASYSGLMLMDIIYDIREYLEKNKVELPVFAAHSMSDRTTLYSGIEYLTNKFEGEHTVFKIDESYELCHADLPLNQIQINLMKFKKSMVDVREECAVPAANPLHQQMLNMMMFFLEQQVGSTTN